MVLFLELKVLIVSIGLKIFLWVSCMFGCMLLNRVGLMKLFELLIVNWWLLLSRVVFLFCVCLMVVRILVVCWWLMMVLVWLVGFSGLFGC